MLLQLTRYEITSNFLPGDFRWTSDDKSINNYKTFSWAKRESKILWTLRSHGHTGSLV